MDLDPSTNLDAALLEKVEALFIDAGLTPPAAYPIETGEVLRLLDKLDYHVSTDDLVAWCSSGMVPAPMVAGRRAWHPHAIWAAFMNCEARKRWKLTNRHAFKFTNAERIVYEARAAGNEFPITDMEAQDVEALLMVMETCDQRAFRNVLRLAIQQKLREV